MANCGYMTITGEQQGLISAGCSTPQSLGNKCQPMHADKILILAFTHNMANLDDARHATHRPVFITKPVDKSSPLLSQALANQERVECLIEFYRTSAQGTQEKFYTVELRGGQVRELTQDMPHVVVQNDGEAQEHLALSYRDIIWTHHSAGTTGYASWDMER
ncbi:Hcp family type VI secretion system effector [Pseudomonas sp. DTU_2021_1001937_2_SI_NGA_ILE_001]|uniref:Hcp family type VI secretion system effector n=1 Tax=Pseudomonas sp. DTU_2021_1001937_2_SI_NGA_ILE_001 TaxID=3077589 RepID=UPI0028FC2C9E|nr:Hcp family type VI secretion system effector [Pseudomonas sp. DTU_2021_1001937_2_SI_NGA_ILE_001]WNW13780.1 Hcp family type VI secretion system effector [Pseudomonas sp. DTU_2021_1001937_2_SI_NGA_ILE_001]